MSITARKFLIGLILLLLTGAAIGWLYGHADWGLLAAALVALIWQARQLLSFERALRTGDFADFRSGEGIWQQIFSRFRFEHDRAARRKQNYRMLLREIRKSTNAMPDGAVILDANNEIITSNRAARQLAGLKRKKDRGQRVDNILRDPELTRLLQSGDYTLTIEMQSPVNDGDWLNCRIVPYGADQKLLLLRDVTEGFRIRKIRRDFVANASHELRSPLTVISGYLDALAEDRKRAFGMAEADRADARPGGPHATDIWARCSSCRDSRVQDPHIRIILSMLCGLIETTIGFLAGHSNVAPSNCRCPVDGTSERKQRRDRNGDRQPVVKCHSPYAGGRQKSRSAGSPALMAQT